MADAGYKTRLRRSGTPTAFANSLMSTATTVANTFEIASTVFAVWDRDAEVGFAGTSAGGSTISSTDIATLEYAFGRVTFKSAHSSVWATGTYLPLAGGICANAYSLNLAGDVLDNTCFLDSSTDADYGYRTRQIGLRDVMATITRFGDFGSTEAGSSVHRFFEAWQNEGTTANPDVVVAEFNPGGSATVFARGFFRVASIDNSGDVGSLETAEVQLELDGSSRGSFGWSDKSWLD